MTLLRTCSVTAVLLFLATGVGCNRTSPELDKPGGASTAPATPPAWNVTVQPLEMPTAARSAQPHLSTSSRGVLASWLELTDTGATLKFAERTSAGWSAPQNVASGDNWFISDADVPAVMRMKDGTLIASWYPAVDFRLEAYDIRLSYSKDEGKTWARPLVPHHDKTRTQHGFVSMFEMPTGGLGLVWLDGRHQGKQPEDAEMAMYFASFDGAWKQTAEVAANMRVCECCTTSVAITDDGPIAAFRDRSDKEIRDIHVSRLESGKWTDAVAVHDDNWEIDACPVNGPAISARGRQVATAWFTAKDDKGQAWVAFSSDAGRTWGQPIRLDDETSLGHVDVELLDDGSAVATWMEFTKDHREFRMRRVEPSGARSGSINIAAGQGRVSGYPRMARSGNELVFAWTEGSEEEGAQKVKGAVARIP